jgi:hypothetical protein
MCTCKLDMKSRVGIIRNLNFVLVGTLTVQVTNYSFKVIKYVKTESADEAYIMSCRHLA